MSRSVKKNSYVNVSVSDDKKYSKGKIKNWYKDEEFIAGDRAYDKKICEQSTVKIKAPTYEEFKSDYPDVNNEKILQRKYHKLWLNK